MTANSMQHDLEKYHALGAADVITKPFDPMSLPEKIQDIWRSSKEGRKH
jgi:CheY-like chemotaxis protein